MDPPTVNRRPFWSITVAQTYLSDGTSVEVDVASIVKSLIEQLGLPVQAAASITIKVQRVDLYAVSKANSTVRPSISADYSGLIPSSADPTTPGNAIVSYPLLSRQNDIGGVSTSAKVSYTWPLSMRDMPLSNTANFVVFEVGTNMTEIDARIHLQWSSADIASPLA